MDNNSNTQSYSTFSNDKKKVEQIDSSSIIISMKAKPLPIGVKCIAFSFLQPKEVASKISMLSKEIREHICSTELLD